MLLLNLIEHAVFQKYIVKADFSINLSSHVVACTNYKIQSFTCVLTTKGHRIFFLSLQLRANVTTELATKKNSGHFLYWWRQSVTGDIQ